MNKFIISTIALATVMSCSSSNDGLLDESNNSTPILLTKATEITDDGDTYVMQYKYDGDKLVEEYETADNFKTVYTYSGDNIIKTQDFESGVMKYMREFTYSNDRVISEKVTSKYTGTLVYTKNFQYINDNHVKYNELSGSTYNPSTGVHSDFQYRQNDVILSNGNLATATSTDNGVTSVYTFNYDAKNNPMKNVKGYLKINQFLSLEGQTSNNNLLTYNSSTSGSISSTSGLSATHTLNGNNFPSKTVQNYTSSIFGPKTETYLYEYNK